MSYDAGKNGIVVWEGQSLLDGKPISVLATGFKRTKNNKIGKMLSTWIMRSDIPPIEANRSGCDSSVCGNCKHRNWRTCYVNIANGPYNVWDAYNRRSYKYMDDFSVFCNRSTRIGSYGDPAAVPFTVWSEIYNKSDTITSYTHQWKYCDSRLKNICMASVDSMKECETAQKLGWRTFRILLEDELPLKNEILCPASINKGKVTCKDCGLCSGLSSKSKKNIAIYLHGPRWKVFRFNRIRNLQRQHKKFSHLLERSPVKI